MANDKPQVIVEYDSDGPGGRGVITIMSHDIEMLQKMYEQFEELVKVINA